MINIIKFRWEFYLQEIIAKPRCYSPVIFTLKMMKKERERNLEMSNTQELYAAQHFCTSSRNIILIFFLFLFPRFTCFTSYSYLYGIRKIAESRWLHHHSNFVFSGLWIDVIGLKYLILICNCRHWQSSFFKCPRRFKVIFLLSGLRVPIITKVYLLLSLPKYIYKINVLC